MVDRRAHVELELAHLGCGMSGASVPSVRHPLRALHRALASAGEIWRGLHTPAPHTELLERALLAIEDATLCPRDAPTQALLLSMAAFLDDPSPRVTPLVCHALALWKPSGLDALFSALVGASSWSIHAQGVVSQRGPGGKRWAVHAESARLETVSPQPQPAWLDALRTLRAWIARASGEDRVAARIRALELAQVGSPLARLWTCYLLPDETELVQAVAQNLADEGAPLAGWTPLILATCLEPESRDALLDLGLSQDRHVFTWILPTLLAHLDARVEGPLLDLLATDFPEVLAPAPRRIELHALPRRLRDLPRRELPPAWREIHLPELRLAQGEIVAPDGVANLVACWREEPNTLTPDRSALLDEASLFSVVEALIQHAVAIGGQRQEMWTLSLLLALPPRRFAPTLARSILAWPAQGLFGYARRGLEILAARPDAFGLRALGEVAGQARGALAEHAAEQLQALASKMALSPDALEDCIEARYGLDAPEGWRFDYGRRSFRLELTSALEARIRTRRGHRKTLPWIDGRDDGALARAERERYRRLERALAKRRVAIFERFERALRSRRALGQEVWDHPVLRQVADALLWRLDTVLVPGASLHEGARATLVHPIELSEVERTRWLQALEPQPILQLERPVFPTPSFADYLGREVEPEKLRGLSRYGWTEHAPDHFVWASDDGMRARLRLEPLASSSRWRLSHVEMDGDDGEHRAVWRSELIYDLERVIS